MNAINVKSEIGPLKKGLLHRPGSELLNLTPDSLSRLLFDDIPFLPEAQKEHDEFARILKENNIDTYPIINRITKYPNDKLISYIDKLIPVLDDFTLHDILNKIKDNEELFKKYAYIVENNKKKIKKLIRKLTEDHNQAAEKRRIEEENRLQLASFENK